LSVPDETKATGSADRGSIGARVTSRGSISARVTWSLVALIALLALVTAVTTILLMAHVPPGVAPGSIAESPGRTSNDLPLPVGPSRPEFPRQEVERLLVFSATTLSVVVIVGAIVVRWIVRRSLAPLKSMAEAAQQAASTDLRARVPVGRVRDEVTDLAVAFNIMLARLDDAFEAQRRFAANASHELQTPLAATQAVIDDALADPLPGRTRDLLQDLRTLNSRSVQTVRTLLDLANTQGGPRISEEVDLTLVIRQEAKIIQAAAREHEVTIDQDLQAAVVGGDATLIRLMARNLLDNAVRHNRPGGRVELTLRGEGSELVLRIANSGALLTADDVVKLVEPFHRGAGRLPTRGNGLGATLVTAIVTRHGWQLGLHPAPEGGLVAEVRIPRVQPIGKRSGDRVRVTSRTGLGLGRAD
jgi:two-component system, OmpR family, sensor histidine kinase VanS